MMPRSTIERVNNCRFIVFVVASLDKNNYFCEIFDLKNKVMLKEGLSYTSKTDVSLANCAVTAGSGDLEVFATPAMVALMENAAMKAVAEALPEGATTVGAEMNVTHIKPSGIGAKVSATATLTAVEGRKLTFEVEASDEGGVIGEGVHIRYVVDRARFMSKIDN